ncbi:MAG: tyrosine-type recombinase/integrase [Oligoflexia bacterium]|nr:tyrosine-type recombinase/integrase [Oligoflexia bacterium]
MKNENGNGNNKTSSKNHKRFLTLKKHTGIRKDLLYDRYEAYKSIDGVRYSERFASLVEAIKWRNEFSPTNNKSSSDSVQASTSSSTSPSSQATQFSPHEMEIRRANGIDSIITFKEVWKLYQKFRFPLLSTARRDKVIDRSHFMNRLLDEKMANLNPNYFDLYIERMKRECLRTLPLRRYNYEFELDIIKTVFNWYRENYDHTFYLPILKRHYDLGVVRRLKKVNRKMSPENLILFFSTLQPFWRDVAQFQFFTATRIGEVAGLQIGSINFKKRTVTIENNAVFDHTGDKHVIELKPPKNGEIRVQNITHQLEEILRRRLTENEKNCSYLFNIRGKPLSYRQCQNAYNRALKTSGLYQQGFRSTHFLRHSAATITRELFGSLDYVAAMTGHKDLKMLQHYASLSADKFQMEASEKLEDFMLKTKKSGEGRGLSLVENS